MKTADELELRAKEIRGLFARGDAKALPVATIALLDFIEAKVLTALKGPCGPACLALSVKHRAFVHGKIGGGPKGEPLSDTAAYLAAYPKAKRTSAGVAGHRLLKNAKILSAIAEHERSAAAATVDEKNELAQTMRFIYTLDSSATHRDRIGAGNLRANMEPGWRAPVETVALPGLDSRKMIDRLIAAAKAGDEEAAAALERSGQAGWKVDVAVGEYIGWLETRAGIKGAE